MSAAFWLKLYLLTVPVFFLIDMVWLGFVARNFYKEQLHSLLSPQVNWTAALLFYFIYIAGILFFAVRPERNYFVVTLRSYAPMSQAAPWGRAMPSRSTVTSCCRTPASMAGLPGRR